MVIIITHLIMTFLLTAALILSLSCISSSTTNTAIQASSSSEPNTSGAFELREQIIEKVEKVSELIQRAQKNAVEQEKEARGGDGNPGSMIEDYNNNGVGSYSDATNPNPNPNPNLNLAYKRSSPALIPNNFRVIVYKLGTMVGVLSIGFISHLMYQSSGSAILTK